MRDHERQNRKRFLLSLNLREITVTLKMYAQCMLIGSFWVSLEKIKNLISILELQIICYFFF